MVAECVHSENACATLLLASLLALGRQTRWAVFFIAFFAPSVSLALVRTIPFAKNSQWFLHRSSQDSIYREREPETADRGSDGDDANETCAAGAGLMSRNSLKTSAVGAS